MFSTPINDLRAQYLWDMANLCHIDANGIDGLRALDFFIYITSIDKYHAELERNRREQEHRQADASDGYMIAPQPTTRR